MCPLNLRGVTSYTFLGRNLQFTMSHDQRLHSGSTNGSFAQQTSSFQRHKASVNKPAGLFWCSGPLRQLSTREKKIIITCVYFQDQLESPRGGCSWPNMAVWRHGIHLSLTQLRLFLNVQHSLTITFSHNASSTAAHISFTLPASSSVSGFSHHGSRVGRRRDRCETEATPQTWLCFHSVGPDLVS